MSLVTVLVLIHAFGDASAKMTASDQLTSKLCSPAKASTVSFKVSAWHSNTLNEKFCLMHTFIIFIGQAWRLYKFRKAKVPFKVPQDTEQSLSEP
jgi:hypothetical protein